MPNPSLNVARTILTLMLMPIATTAAAEANVPVTQPADAGAPVTLPNARQFDFTSKINGLGYRVFVYTTPKLDLAKPQPVIYLFDGNWYFAAACNAMDQVRLKGLVVGVGYPSADDDEIGRRRSFDLSLPTTPPDKTNGGGDEFLRVVNEEVKPLVNSHYAIDPARQAVFGQSLGGLMVLRQLFREPQAYSIYTAASPSIWWDNRAVLADEATFSDRARSGGLHLKLLITSAGDEEYHGTDPTQLEKARRNGMVSNASNLCDRLSVLDSKNVVVTRAIFPQETHQSGAIAAMARALRFTFGKM